MSQLSLAALRVNKGMTQQDVADRLGLSKSTVVSLENSEKPIRDVYIYAFAKLYDVEIDNMRIPS